MRTEDVFAIGRANPYLDYYTVGVTYRNGNEKGRSFVDRSEAEAFFYNWTDAPNVAHVALYGWAKDKAGIEDAGLSLREWAA